jgi:protein SCO1/2
MMRMSQKKHLASIKGKFLNTSCQLRKFTKIVCLGLALSASAPSSAAFARDLVKGATGVENEVPASMKDIGIEEHLGDTVNLDLKFKNEKGEVVPLRHYFDGHKPVLLSLAYYSCPSLCNFHLNGLNDAFKQMKQPLGHEFNVVVVSIEPKETPELASAKRASYLKAYGRPEGDGGWHFLVGSQDQIAELAKEVGFKYRWDEGQKQYAHASAAYVLTPIGQISRYLYGIVFDPKTVRLSMIEASEGRIGTIVDKLTLFCFHYDQKGSKYALAAFNVVRAAALLIVLVMAMFMTPFWLKARRDNKTKSDRGNV